MLPLISECPGGGGLFGRESRQPGPVSNGSSDWLDFKDHGSAGQGGDTVSLTAGNAGQQPCCNSGSAEQPACFAEMQDGDRSRQYGQGLIAGPARLWRVDVRPDVASRFDGDENAYALKDSAYFGQTGFLLR